MIVPDGTDKHALQHALYLAIVADVPVNLTLYTVQEWDALTQDEDSYAAWIRRKGRVLYEQNHVKAGATACTTTNGWTKPFWTCRRRASS